MIYNRTNIQKCTRDVVASGYVTNALGGALMKDIISGIYEIRNTINGHRYIGSAVDIKHRWACHISDLNKGKHHSIYLQRAWNKYGKNSFEFSVIECCNKYSLIQREQFYIDSEKPEYNISPTAGSSLGVIATLITRLNISNAQKKRFSSKEEREKHSRATSNRRQSLETRKKISNAFIGRLLTEEWKKNIHIGKKPYMKAVLQYDMNGKLINRFDCMADAEKETGIFRSNIRKHINGKFAHAGGFIWRYAEDDK